MFVPSRLAFVVRFACVVLTLPSLAWAQASFETLPLGGNSPFDPAYSLKISADGSAVVGRTGFGRDPGPTAAVWRDGIGTTDLGGLPPANPGDEITGHAYGISADGTTVVGHSFRTDGMAGSGEAVIYRPDGTVVPIANGLVGDSYAFDVSADGAVVVGTHAVPIVASGFIYDETNGRRMLNELISHPGASHAAAISDDGSTITGWIGADTVSPVEAFLYDEVGGLRTLGLLPNGVSSRGDAISADGSTVVGYATNDVGGFAMKWTEAEGMVNLGSLAAGLPNRRISQAYGVNGDGSVVVGESNDQAFIHADEYGGMIAVRDLLISLGVVGLEDWVLWEAIGISDDGKVITGWGGHPDFGSVGVAWRAVIPEPSTALLLGLGLMGIATSSREAR